MGKYFGPKCPINDEQERFSYTYNRGFAYANRNTFYFKFDTILMTSFSYVKKSDMEFGKDKRR